MKFGIGQAITRIEDQRLLTGTGQFVDDRTFPNQAHVVFVRSPYAFARITSIDVAEARAAPGVIAVFTGADLVAAGAGPLPTAALKNAQGEATTSPPYHPLAVDEVRFVGQAVVAVVAESRREAQRAAELVLVDYDAQQAVASIDAALAADAPQLWSGAPGNVLGAMKWGNAAACEEAFAQAKHVTRLTLHNQRLVPATLEPRACAAEFDAAGGRLTLYASSQNPATFQQTLARSILKVPNEQVRVRVGDVGGGFGMKALLHAEDAVCAWAARQLGRPMRWVATRNEDFLAATHGRDQKTEAELAFDGDGKILGLRVQLTGNVGAYGYGAGAIINLAVGPKVITGVYHVPALDIRAQAVLTSTNMVAAYRGAGRPESIYLIERLMDQAAVEMSIDRAELRRRNLVRPEQMPYKTPMGETFDSGNFPRILEQALAAADWNGYEGRARESQARGKLRGHAVSTFLEWTGASFEETVHLHVEADGRVRLLTAMQAMGQGIETSYVQILAEALELDPAQIEIVQGDSDAAQGIGSMGSRSLYIGGSAMLTASQQTITQGKDLAAKALEAPAPDITYKAGRFVVAGTDHGIDLFDLARRQPEQRIAVTTLQKVDGPSWPNSSHVCEVEIDADTGVVEVVRYTTMDDIGRVINPLIVAGQVHGGIAQAIGQALYEDTRYDDDGQLLTGTFLDYALPRAEDLPNFDTHYDESQPCKINPLGAKGVGELGTVGGTPTVINAVLDALRPLGVKDIAMPATPERVWSAIQQAKKLR
ncbi:MAG TPA: xanthine dehydrogenase family protein molybdopterin-binding subunit [Burkholderiaceae bacterium]|nr:xanthine dehydrogenase family protein molybdopterin-binding subunit [Burkholderiaceae bacterium]